MAHLDRKEYFSLHRSWQEDDEKENPKVTLFNKTARLTNKAEVTKFNGEKNIDFFSSVSKLFDARFYEYKR